VRSKEKIINSNSKCRIAITTCNTMILSIKMNVDFNITKLNLPIISNCNIIRNIKIANKKPSLVRNITTPWKIITKRMILMMINHICKASNMSTSSSRNTTNPTAIIINHCMKLINIMIMIMIKDLFQIIKIGVCKTKSINIQTRDKNKTIIRLSSNMIILAVTIKIFRGNKVL